MAEESEKRFHAIMDKLFHAPRKPKSKSTTPTPPQSTSSSAGQLSRGKKRPNMSLSVSEPKSRGEISLVSSGSVQTPVCRPWDRGDLMRRVATFKSMKWFAKPQVVSAVNCARRGWINVDTDTIACEACGARIYFSTPSSWTQHQVEKAALVFSLKLDNGHKLLCPWIDNACDETLVQFPPTSAAVLVDEYKRRSSALLDLLALPVISSSAIDYMRSPQLEHFLRGSSIIGSDNEPVDTSQMECLGNEIDRDFSVSYYQAQKIISLCGWEPRSLPYVVDCKNRQYQSSRDANLPDFSHGVSNGYNSSIVVYSSGMEETIEENGVQADPNSVVLDCRLCGASVGLWTFSTVPRPLELLRLIGYSEVNGDNDSAHHKEDAICGDVGASGTHDLSIVNHADNREGTFNTAPTSATSSTERQLTLNLTIAGGPPPTKQNFRATISMPVIGRNLRAWISSDTDFRDHRNRREKTLTGQGFQPEDVESLHGKQVDDGECNSTSIGQLPCSNNDIVEEGNTLRNDTSCDISSEGAKNSGQGFPETSTPYSIIENSIQTTPNLVDGSSKNDKLPENAENVATVNPAVEVGSSSQVGDSSMETTGAQLTTRNGEIVQNDASITVEADATYLQQKSVTDTVCGTLADSQDGSGFKASVHPVNNNVVPSSIGKNQDQLRFDEAMKFDPIRQHRHFCPWIASTGNSPPGWKQVLFALQRQKEFSSPLSTNAPSSALIEVDDPIASVKKLFMSPSAKKMKLAHGSS
ncbi:hypothetical protein CsSME_00053917 [Camellia sinensis var. sinensis]